MQSKDFTYQELRDLQIRFKNIGLIAEDTNLKTKYLVVASNIEALILKININKEGRYE